MSGGEAGRIRRQDDVELGAAVKQSFGNDKFGPGGERAEAEAGPIPFERRRDRLGRALARTAKIDRARWAQQVEPGGVGAERLLDRDELAQGRGMILQARGAAATARSSAARASASSPRMSQASASVAARQ